MLLPGNLGATLRDVSLVLSAPLSSYPDPPSAASNKTTLKALLRSARALSGLEKLPEALDALLRLRTLEVEMDQGEKDVGKKVRLEVEANIAKQEKREGETKEKARRVKEGEKRIKEALLVRGFSRCGSDAPAKPSHTVPRRCPSQSDRIQTPLLILPKRHHPTPL